MLHSEDSIWLGKLNLGVAFIYAKKKGIYMFDKWPAIYRR